MARNKIVDESGIYFTTHTIVEWLPVFKESKYFEIIIESLKYCQKNKHLHSFPAVKGFVDKPEYWLYSSASPEASTTLRDWAMIPN